MKRGYFREGQEYLERALSAVGNPPSVLRAKALMSLGSMTFFQGDFVRSRVLLEEAAALGRAAGDLSVVGFSLGMMAVALLEFGDIAGGVRIATEGQAAGRASTTPWVQGPSLACLAYLAMHEGDFDRAGRLHEEALELALRQGEKWAIGDLAVRPRVAPRRSATARGGQGSLRRGNCAPRGIRRPTRCRLVSGDSLQEPRQRTDKRYARLGSGAQWRVCLRGGRTHSSQLQQMDW